MYEVKGDQPCLGSVLSTEWVDLLLRLCLLGQKILTFFEAIRINGLVKGGVFCSF